MNIRVHPLLVPQLKKSFFFVMPNLVQDKTIGDAKQNVK